MQRHQRPASARQDANGALEDDHHEIDKRFNLGSEESLQYSLETPRTGSGHLGRRCHRALAEQSVGHPKLKVTADDSNPVCRQ